MSSPLIAWLREVATQLADEPTSARSAAELVGGLVDTPGHGLPLVVRAERAGVARATVADRAESEILSHMSVELRDDADLTVADLAAEFGKYMRPPRVDANSPLRLVFYRVAEGQAGSVTLSVEVIPAEDIESARVTAVTVRFDAAD